MSTSTEIRWYIDSIDPRAGLAFASYRKPDLEAKSAMEAAGPTAFIAPPSFAPEFLEGRSIAFGLARGHGQIGLFLERGELPFDSLEAVREFVRRVYVRGCSGDGPGEGGGERVAPPPDGEAPPPELEVTHPPPSDSPDPVHRFLVFVREMMKRMKELKPGASDELTPLKHAAKPEGGARRILIAALQIIGQMEVAAKDRYQRALLSERLCRIFLRMGLWPLLREELKKGRFLKAFTKQAGFIEYWMKEQRAWDWPFSGPYTIGAADDAYADLAKVPVPTVRSSATGEAFQTLQGLLNAMCSTPVDVLNTKPAEDETRAGLALFAAAYLNIGAEGAPMAFRTEESIAAAFVENAAKAGVTWLSSNLPRRVYTRPVEKLICAASQLHRNTVATASSSQDFRAARA